MKNKINTNGWNCHDYINFLRTAIESGNKKSIIEAYDIIEESTIDFIDTPDFIQEEYDELVEKGNSILGY